MMSSRKWGKDAAAGFSSPLRGPNTSLDFDLELAKKQTVDNPVYYLQYAHARILFRSSVRPKDMSGGYKTRPYNCWSKKKNAN